MSPDSLNQTSSGNIWEHLGTFGNSFARLWHRVCWQVRFDATPNATIGLNHKQLLI